jgi:hypothetical protein
VTFRIFSLLAVAAYLLASSPAIAARRQVTDDVAPFKAALLQKLDAKQFAELETLETELRHAKARLAGGDWKLFRFYEVLSAGHVLEHAPIESDWLGVIATLKEWQEHSPASGVPALLLADAYISYAWFARGDGRSETVKESDWPVFKDRLNQAAFHLNSSRRLLPKHPQWYVTALAIARGSQWPRDRAEALIKEAGSVEPGYQHAYSAMAIFLLPRWYGEPGDWEQFAKETAQRIGGAEGSAVYNHIALRVADQHSNTEFFEENDVSWAHVQSTFADREKLYGAGIQGVNQMCLLAGGAMDKPAARRFMKRIGEAWDQSVWRTRTHFDRYQQWLEAE